MEPSHVEIVVVAPNVDSPFVQRDTAALRRHFGVGLLAADEFRSKAHLLYQLEQTLRRHRPRLLVLWFIDPHYVLEAVALARMYSARVVAITGGLDVDFVPELGLGGLRWWHNRTRTRLGLRLVDIVLAISSFSARRIERLAAPRRLEVVPMGVDLETFGPDGHKEPMVVTVCFEITRETAALKGLETVIEAARLLPDLPFTVVGRPGPGGGAEALERTAPRNVSFTRGFIPDDDLRALYARASVYVQVSAHEGFGVAVAEAMASECVPVVTGGHALDEVVGDAGLYVPYGDARATAAAIGSALDSTELRVRARQRIVDRFPLARRDDRLVELCGGLIRR